MITLVSASSSSEDVYRAFPRQGAGTSAYVFMLIQVTDTTGLAADTNQVGDYFAALMPGSSASTYVSRLQIRRGSEPGTFQLGIRAVSQNPATVWAPKPLFLHETHCVVVAYTVVTGNTNDIARLWVDPPIPCPEPAPDAEQTSAASTDPADVGRLAFRQDGLDTPDAAVDGVVILDAWEPGLPVELAGFRADLSLPGTVILRWSTLSETNSYGFEVQKAPDGGEFATIDRSFVPGGGTTTSTLSYEFTDSHPLPGRSFYRLKHIDLDGACRFCEPITVDLPTGVDEVRPEAAGLRQNYPNPFNPRTRLSFVIPRGGPAQVEVYSPLGQHIATLYNGEAEAGRVYRVEFDGQDLAGGTYFCRLVAPNLTSVRRMLLVR
jgi:hypothetical protein